MIIPILMGAAAVVLAGNRLRMRARTEREYAQRFMADVTGVVAGAEPFTLRGSSERAVLLLHGSGDSPQTLRYLGTRLNAAGYTVSAPLLPGHGRSPRAFAKATADEYVAHAGAALRALHAEHESVGVIGLSMGGAIAAQLAAEDARVRAVVLLAPYLVPPPEVRRVARAAPLWGLVAPYLAGRGEASVLDPHASRDSRAYGTFSPGALRALVVTAAAGLRALPQLSQPTMVVNSDRDNRIPRECAEQALRAFRATPEIHWVSGCGHVITIDYCKDEVARLVLRFLDARLRVSS